MNHHFCLQVTVIIFAKPRTLYASLGTRCFEVLRRMPLLCWRCRSRCCCDTARFQSWYMTAVPSLDLLPESFCDYEYRVFPRGGACGNVNMTLIPPCRIFFAL